MSGRAITPTEGTVADAAACLRERDGGYIVATHRKPDGDAIGSLLGMGRALRNAGRDVVMWHPDVPAVPDDLAFMVREDEQIVSALPADREERTLVVLDCATAGRLADDPPESLAAFVLNIDHHHDNGRFGDLNVIVDASSASEIVVDLLNRLDWPLDEAIAEALHIGIVTDTGRLSYSNVTAATLQADARLVAAGVDVAAVARRLYENMPLASARLLGIALAGLDARLDGRLIVSVLGPEQFSAAGGDDSDGIAEALRAIRGAEVGALIRASGHGGLRVSLRAASDRVDVSKIAAHEGGGGHRAAAGLTTHRPADEFVAWLEDETRAQLDGH